MSNSKDNAKAIKSYQGFEEKTYAARKGRICFIKKIHFEMHPPSVTVQMMDTDSEVGTEFDRLQHIGSWFCDTCSAENKDINADKCFFCKFNRSYKEKITIKSAEEGDEEQKEIKQQESKPIPNVEPEPEPEPAHDEEPEESEYSDTSEQDDNDNDNDIETEDEEEDQDEEEGDPEEQEPEEYGYQYNDPRDKFRGNYFNQRDHFNQRNRFNRGNYFNRSNHFSYFPSFWQ